MKAQFKVRQDLAYWACDAGQFKPGEVHEVEGSQDVMQAICDAAAAGSLVDVGFDDADNAPRSETDAESIMKLNAAMNDGSWLEGHSQQFALDEEREGTIEVGGDT